MMHAVLCPRCQIRVLPSPEGICPGCRKAIPIPLPAPPTKECPECRAALAQNAVLCVTCGFHLQRGGYLGTAVERGFQDDIGEEIPLASFQEKDLNPYASPRILNEQPPPELPPKEKFVADLTPYAVRHATAVVSTAEGVYLNIFLCFFTCIGGFLVG